MRNVNATVGQLVTEDYRRADVFKSFGIDFCCGGKKTVNDVCNEKGIDSNRVWQALEDLQQRPTGSVPNYQQWPQDFMCDYIANTHHKYVSQTIPVLLQYLKKLESVHGTAHPELVEIARHFDQIAAEMTAHMGKEEQVLFPYIKKLVTTEQNGQAPELPPFGTIKNPIQMMEAEHESAGGGMEAIRELSGGFVSPEDACNTYRVTYAKLEEFEADLHNHIHLENNILFPAAVKLEDDLFTKRN